MLIPTHTTDAARDSTSSTYELCRMLVLVTEFPTVDLLLRS